MRPFIFQAFLCLSLESLEKVVNDTTEELAKQGYVPFMQTQTENPRESWTVCIMYKLQSKSKDEMHHE